MFTRIVFDPVKDIKNVEKHGVSLALAAQLEWRLAFTWADQRKDYGELRQRALVPLGDSLYFVAFVNRRDDRRIISLRKTNNREKIYYASRSLPNYP